MTAPRNLSSLAPRRKPWSFLALGALLALAGLVQGEEAREADVVREVLWQGYPDGLEASSSPQGWALAPDGSGFLYYQGLPWRRVMYQPLKPPGSAPRMVGAIQPFGSRAPRFSPRGDWVYFTALEGSSRDGNARAFVARARLPGTEVEPIYPSKGSASSPHAILLDVHPGGTFILVGTTAQAPAGELPREDDLLEVEEVPLEGPRGAAGKAERLGFRVSAGAEAAYSASGEKVEYSGALELPAPGRTPPTHAFDRAARTHRLVHPGGFGLPERRGDREVCTILFPHLGSFGWDGYPEYAVRSRRTPADGPRLLVWGPEALRLSRTPPVPVVFSGGLLLARGGQRDQPLPMVLDWVRAETDPGRLSWRIEPGGSSLAAAALLFDPRFLGGAILAHRPLAIEPVLLDLQRSLGAHGAPVALQATLIESGAGAAPGAGDRVEVLEMSPGYLRVERTAAVPARAAEEEEGPTDLQDATEVASFDGERCWVKSPAGSFDEISPVSFAARINAYSLFRLFLDPARLGDPLISFQSATRVPPADSGGTPALRIEFSYPDGYRGELFLEATGGIWLPLSVRTPLLFETRLLEREIGQVPQWKTLGFKDWRAWKGRLVPHRLEFHDGLSRRVVTLSALEEKRGATRSLFEPPLEQAKDREEE